MYFFVGFGKEHVFGALEEDNEMKMHIAQKIYFCANEETKDGKNGKIPNKCKQIYTKKSKCEMHLLFFSVFILR